MGCHPDVDAAMERAVATMKAAGAAVVDAEIPTQGQWDDPEFEVLLFEFKAGLESYLQKQRRAGRRRSSQLIEFNKQHADEEMPLLRPGDSSRRRNAKGPLSDPAYLEARSEGAPPRRPRRHRCGAEAANSSMR